MKLILIIMVALLASNAVAAQNFLDQMCRGTTAPTTVQDDDICGLYAQGKWQAIRNQMSKMIVANRNAGNPRVYYTDPKFWRRAPEKALLERDWMKREDVWVSQTSNAVHSLGNIQGHTLHFAEPEHYFALRLQHRLPTFFQGRGLTVRFGFNYGRVPDKRFTFKTGGKDRSIRSPSHTKNFLESFLDCVESQDIRDYLRQNDYTFYDAEVTDDFKVTEIAHFTCPVN